MRLSESRRRDPLTVSLTRRFARRSLVYKLKLDRTIYRSCGRVSWGPKWRGWWVNFYFQAEIRLDESRCVINCFSKNTRHPGIYEVKVSAAQMTKLLNFNLPIMWRDLMEDSDEDPEIKFQILLSKLRLVNTIDGPQIILSGEETNYQLVQWPEERRKHRDEARAALQIEKVWRGRLGRKQAKHRKIWVDVKYEGAKKRQRLALEKKRRSSAAVTLQASIKRGFARKRAERVRRLADVKEEEKRKEATKLEYLNIEATKINKIVRGGMDRRRFIRLRIEARAEEMERQGIYEADVIMDGTRLFITGKIVDKKDTLDINDLAFKMEAKDEMMGRRAKLVLGNNIISKVMKKIEDGGKEEGEEREEEGVVEEAVTPYAADDISASASTVSVNTTCTKVLNCRAIFLKCIEELTLFKSVEKNIFILALKHKTAVKKIHRASTIQIEY